LACQRGRLRKRCSYLSRNELPFFDGNFPFSLRYVNLVCDYNLDPAVGWTWTTRCRAICIAKVSCSLSFQIEVVSVPLYCFETSPVGYIVDEETAFAMASSEISPPYRRHIGWNAGRWRRRQSELRNNAFIIDFRRPSSRTVVRTRVITIVCVAIARELIERSPLLVV
jgi:hypothetical protein